MMSQFGRPQAPDRSVVVASSLIFLAAGLAALIVVLMSFEPVAPAIDFANIGMVLSFTTDRSVMATVTLVVAILAVVLAFVFMARVSAARWMLVVLAAFVVLAHVAALVQISDLFQPPTDLLLLLVVSALLWSTAMVSALLPATGRSIRRV